MSRAKYPIGTVMKHKSSGLICKIIDRNSYCVIFEILKGDPTKTKNINYGCWFVDDNEIIKLNYSPNSVNRLFEPLGVASAVLYAKT